VKNKDVGQMYNLLCQMNQILQKLRSVRIFWTKTDETLHFYTKKNSPVSSKALWNVMHLARHVKTIEPFDGRLRQSFTKEFKAIFQTVSRPVSSICQKVFDRDRADCFKFWIKTNKRQIQCIRKGK
jgi:hypothetical protein